ncbi:MAG TPA: TadE family protein [Anaerolineaceae bacterium]|nr:TadE family protein [Anaerolineaceae bacterium]
MTGDVKFGSRKHGKLQGQSLVEMALLLPMLLVLVIGAIEFGRLFYTKIVITNAAREGAYYLSTHISDYDPVTGNAPNTLIVSQNDAKNSGVSGITIAVARNNCCTTGLFSIVVTVNTNVKDLLIISFLSNAFSITSTNYDEFPLNSSVEMMVQ